MGEGLLTGLEMTQGQLPSPEAHPSMEARNLERVAGSSAGWRGALPDASVSLSPFEAACLRVSLSSAFCLCMLREGGAW